MEKIQNWANFINEEVSEETKKIQTIINDIIKKHRLDDRRDDKEKRRLRSAFMEFKNIIQDKKF